MLSRIVGYSIASAYSIASKLQTERPIQLWEGLISYIQIVGFVLSMEKARGL